MIQFLNWLDGVLWGLPLIVLMVATGLYFTVRSGFFQFRHFGWIMRRTAGQLFNGESRESGAEEKGMLSAFEAISTAIGGTVGFGNIAGVATAVAAGGPGAVVWMWLTACLGMILKQVEVTLGCYYRRENEKGEYYGGPTYYMERGLGKERGWGKLWLVPAVIFGIGIFSTFFVTSSNLTAAQVVSGAFHLPDISLGGWKVEGVIQVGIFLSLLTYVITGGGTKRIAAIFSKLVPFMSVLYILMGLGMILVNIQVVPQVVASIFTGRGRFRRLCRQRDDPDRHGPLRVLQRGRMGNLPHDPRLRQDEASGGAGALGFLRGVLRHLCGLLHHGHLRDPQRLLDGRHRRRHPGPIRILQLLRPDRKPAVGGDHGDLHRDHLRRLVHLLPGDPGAFI